MTAHDSRVIHVALADDHRMVREGLRRMLDAVPDLRVVVEAADGHALLAGLRTQPVDVAIVDLSMPGMTGIDLIRRLRSELPDVAVLVLTMHAEEQYAMRAFRCGANGYLTKDSAASELVHAIRKVAGGGGYVTPALAERLAIGLARHDDELPHTRLSDREYEVFRRLVAGQRIGEIAQALHLSAKTVSTHKTRILDKMGLDSTAALIRYGLEQRLFDDDVARS